MSERQAPPGWYPVEGGNQRYWDGSAWTEHFADAKQVTTARTDGSPSRIQSAASTAAHRFASADVEVPEGTLWHAIGKGIGGIVTGRYRMDIYYFTQPRARCGPTHSRCLSPKLWTSTYAKQ